MPQQKKLNWADAAMQKGLVILRQQARAGNAGAKQVLGLVVRMDNLQVKETEMKIPPKQSARGMLRGQIRDFLITVGRNNGLPAKGMGNRILPDFWGRVKEMQTFTTQRSRQIVVVRKKPKPAKKPRPRKRVARR